MNKQVADEEYVAYEAFLTLEKELKIANLCIVGSEVPELFKVSRFLLDPMTLVVWVPNSEVSQPGRGKFTKFAVHGTNKQFDTAKETAKYIENKFEACRTL